MKAYLLQEASRGNSSEQLEPNGNESGAVVEIQKEKDFFIE